MSKAKERLVFSDGYVELEVNAPRDLARFEMSNDISGDYSEVSLTSDQMVKLSDMLKRHLSVYGCSGGPD